MTEQRRVRPDVAAGPERPDPASPFRMDVGWTVVHTRGAGVRHIAELLADGSPYMVRGELHRAVLAAKADMVVARHLTKSDLLSQAVPYHVDVRAVKGVVGAIGTGPHARLVAETVARLAAVLDLPGRLVAASPGPEHDAASNAALERSRGAGGGLEGQLVRVSQVADLTRSISPHSLLVLGAPGGSWLQRQFFGPGHRLSVSAPSGALVVRAAPVRCYRLMRDWNAFGPEMRVADALELLAAPAAPIATRGRIIGIVRRSALLRSPSAAVVATVMEPPVSVKWDDPIAAARRIGSVLDGAPAPVVGPDGDLIGEVAV